MICSLLFALLPAPAMAQSSEAETRPIAEIQGAALASPFVDRHVSTWGVVTAVGEDGFYLQDPVGDGDPATSDGIYAFTYDPPTVAVGECVAVTAEVAEYYAKTELNWLESIVPSGACGSSPITPVSLPTLRPGSDPASTFEALEGMVVRLEALSAHVHGPTKRFAGGELELAFLPMQWQRYIGSAHIFHDQVEVSGLLYLNNSLGAQLPFVQWGDLLHVGEDGLTGVLDYNFGKYQLLPLPAPGEPVWRVTVREHAPASLPPARSDEVGICTLNLHGLGRGTEQFPNAADYEVALRQRAALIAGQLHGCTVLALQETGTPADAEALANVLATEYGLNYAALAQAGAGSFDTEFPLTNSILVDSAHVNVQRVDAVVGCTSRDFGIVPSGECPPGEYPVFDRPPLLVQLQINGAQDAPWTSSQPLWVINNHWKSKSGDEEANARLRAAQAQTVAEQVQTIRSADANAQIVVLGDLNDFYGGAAIDLLQEAAGLFHPYAWLPPLDRYTYIFNGAAQALDHVLITPNLMAQTSLVQILHVHADAAAGETPLARSDHDPVVLRLRPSGSATIGGSLGWGQITLRAANPAGEMIAESVADARGDFVAWGVPPGPLTLHWSAPAWVVLDTATATRGQSVDVPPGWVEPDVPAARHEAAIVGAWVALNTPWLADKLIP